DGRGHIAEFFFGGDCFGIEHAPDRLFAAEAVGDVIVMRYSRRATERLLDENPKLTRSLRDIALHRLAGAQVRMLMLGRMSAPERVAAFLLDMFDRRDAMRPLDLPMSPNDTAGSLWLTLSTVC